MEGLVLPERRSAYITNCVSEVEQDVYGRDNRVPIHDAINYTSGMSAILNAWSLDIGLCVENGKLCVIYNG